MGHLDVCASKIKYKTRKIWKPNGTWEQRDHPLEENSIMYMALSSPNLISMWQELLVRLKTVLTLKSTWKCTSEQVAIWTDSIHNDAHLWRQPCIIQKIPGAYTKSDKPSKTNSTTIQNSQLKLNPKIVDS